MPQSNLYAYFKTAKKPDLELLICEDAGQAQALKDVCLFFERDVVVFPDLRTAFLDDLRPFKEELFELFSALRTYYSAKTKPLVISPLKTLLFPLPNEALLQTTRLEFGGVIDFTLFQEQLHQWGYTFVDIVQVEGEVSFRGDIIDIFVPSHKNPYRISLFDDTIEEIRVFECETQRSQKGEIEELVIESAFFSLSAQQYELMKANIESSDSDAFVKDIASLGFWYLDAAGVNFLEDKTSLYSHNMERLIDEVYELNGPLIKQDSFDAIEILAESDDYKTLALTNAKTLIDVHVGKKITLIASNEAQIKQSSIFDTSALEVRISPIILNVISKTEIVMSLNKEVKKRRRRKSSILLDDLKKGDYVVHEDYGLGIFVGIEQAEILGGVKDFVSIKYLGEDRVLLPVENLEVIDRYISTGSLPALDRLGKGSFAKIKDKVKKRLFEIAAEIINLAASRALIKAPQIVVDKKELKSFQEEAGFEYTDDQETSIAEIIHNMSSGKIMDRLLSGDVGFGKTEVAMNAIFACAKAGFQSVLIVPTTLLSSQHFISLRERFEETGIRVAKIDRFVTAKEKTAVLKSLKAGEIDTVVGTHALFGVEFKNLGLVIIDEEHKFGVKQKEKLKTMHERVHLLSMSATPIPRSLNQALSSIKTMSVLMTPPSERQGVRTMVKAYDEKLIKEVILRELRRGGQVFYVFNSIAQMTIKEGQIKKLLPDLRILMLHSKISGAVTEKELIKFQEGGYDLLLATSIIESGIHMPKVNTMIIDGADRFGIADLHQLRGRVGRGSTEGFAYFIVEDKENLTEDSKKRLVALESNSFLGSGSVLAHHDLEIRGGGNLVGDAQSGHIKNIGYSLYLRMLEDAIKELSNTKEDIKAKVDIKLTISAFISEEVVSEDRLRLEIYRRLSQCEDPREVYEIEEEVGERFGELNVETKQFFELMVIKLLSLEKGITKLMNYGQNITIEYLNGSKEQIKSYSKDDDDIIKEVLSYLRNSKPKKI